MNTGPHPASPRRQAPGMLFIEGDKASGLVIGDSGEPVLSFWCGDVAVQAVLERKQPGPGIVADTLTLSMASPVWFNLKWLVPDHVLNAAMTMNGGLLISAFSDRLPEGGLPLPSPGCGHDSPISTLKPGCFQSLAFNWHPGDQLVMYLVYEIP